LNRGPDSHPAVIGPYVSAICYYVNSIFSVENIFQFNNVSFKIYWRRDSEPFFKNLIKTSKISQRERKETPKNNPRKPPNSAMNDMGGYTQASCLTVMSVLAKLMPKVKVLGIKYLKIVTKRSLILFCNRS
jgi:hypothetical protein